MDHYNNTKGSSIVIYKNPEVGIQKRVLEYPLPATVQTHEVVPVGDNLLVITQQERNSLVKVALDPYSGSPVAATKFAVDHSTYLGAHGLFASKMHPGLVWVTLQFDSSIVLVDPMGADQHMPPKVVKKISLPPPLRGPHVVIEDGADVWVTCKDSGHVARIRGGGCDVEYYPCSRRPIFVAVAQGYVYASLDESSRIFCLELSSETTSEIEIPSAMGSTPVGLVTGPDGNAWFVLLGNPNGGTGTFGRITSGTKITWFHLSTAKKAGLLHLAFDFAAMECDPNAGLRVWLLGSSIGSAANADAIWTVRLQGSPDDPARLAIATEDAIVLPTQSSKAHRVIKHKSGLFVTELGVSIVAHVTGTAVQGPAKDDQAADAYALWGLGALSDRIEYPPITTMPFEEAETNNKRKRT